MLPATLLLLVLQAAPGADAAVSTETVVSASEAGAPLAAAPAVQRSSGTVPAGVPSEYQTLKEQVRQDLNAIRRARYALQRAKQRADAGAAAQAEKRLQEAKESLKRHRSRMRELLGPKPPRVPKGAEKTGG